MVDSAIRIQQFAYEEISDKLWKNAIQTIHQAFAEHRRKGLTMMPCTISKEQLKERSKKCIFFIAFDGEALVGIISLRVEPDSHNTTRGYIDITAVHPSYRRQKIGKHLHNVLENYAKEHHFSFLYLDTSCKAVSSQRHHASNGYKPWFYQQFTTANYRSIIMRKDLNARIYPWRRLYSLCRSWISTHLRYNSEGLPSWFRQKAYFLAHPSRIGMKSFEKKLSLREIQETAYNLLVRFDTICKQHNLKYFLCYGSLIGAIRHKGFIPWDDDIDVTMPLPDYERFIMLMQEQPKDSEIGFIYGIKEGAGTPFAMFTDLKTVAIAPGRDIAHTHPVAIDIFPAYPISDDKEEAYQQINNICDIVPQTWKYFKSPSIRNIRQWIKFHILGKRRLRKLLEQISDIVYKYPWGTTEQIRIMSLVEREHLAMKSNIFEHYLLWDFEGGQFRIPATYHEHLSELYGDYMQLPPPEAQHGVIFEAYKLH